MSPGAGPDQTVVGIFGPRFVGPVRSLDFGMDLNLDSNLVVGISVRKYLYQGPLYQGPHFYFGPVRGPEKI